MSQLKNIYNYLITNRKHELESWKKDYEDIVKRVAGLRTILTKNPNLDLNSSEIYNDDTFIDKEALLSRMFANKGNGIASNGQSTFSGDNFNKVKNDVDFLLALKNLIIDPSDVNHNNLANVWSQKLGKNNPVQTNRATAACTLEVSTTVDAGKFNQVFIWLVKKNLIDKYEGDWYEKNKLVVSKLREVLKDEEDYDEYWCNIFYWEMYENLANPFSLKKQLVKYGAPGTGKTYKAKEVSELQFNIWKAEHPKSELTFNNVHKVVQFHPSYAYEDFMEGLRPVLDAGNQAQLQLVNGTFKNMCIAAGQWEVDIAALVTDNKLENKKWEQLTINDLLPFKDNLTEKHWGFVFEITEKATKLTDIIPPYFIIIDEINRAELSRVFGELMYCLEYRGLKGAIETQYNQLNTASTGMIKLGGNYKFFVPHNLYVIGTMNTVDRSVESFDFALRRRFRWEEVKPSINLLKHHLQGKNPAWVKLSENLRNLNQEIRNEPLLGKDYCIGHAYLMDLGYDANTTYTEVKKLVWEDSILPLLEEYVRGTGRESEILKTFTNSFGV